MEEGQEADKSQEAKEGQLRVAFREEKRGGAGEESPEQEGRREDVRQGPGWVEKSLGVLNGIVGDYLYEEQNDLQLVLSFVQENKTLEPEREVLQRALPQATGRVCVLIHGLCSTEAIWTFPAGGEDYGTLLQRDLDYTPLYVRYNTGLHISENGEGLARLLEQLVEAYPVELEELVLIGHSMGGLVARSACHTGLEQKQRWVSLLRHVCYLGAPHLGSPLEKVGHLLSEVLGVFPQPYLRLARSVINLRSRGIQDLRYGDLVQADWQKREEDLQGRACRTAVPLLEGVSHHLVAGSLTENPRHLASFFLGDALVRIPSASGQPQQRHLPAFSLDDCRLFPCISHNELAYHPDVYEQLRNWIQPA